MTTNYTTCSRTWKEIPLPDGQIRSEVESESYNNWIVSTYPGNNELLSITKDGVSKTFKVVGDYEWSWNIQKTQVRASGGAEGLIKHIIMVLPEYADAIPDCNYVIRMVSNIYEKCKPVC